MPSTAPVVVDTVHSAVGRRSGPLGHTHPNEILGTVLSALIDRTSIDPVRVGRWSVGASELGIDAGRVNPNGGAIALGHPLGGDRRGP